MLCPKCRADIRKGLTFCPRCGAEFRAPLLPPDEEILDLAEMMPEDVPDAAFERGDARGGQGFAQRSAYPQPERFYQKTWFIILALIFFWPLGAFLMWKYAGWNKPAKIVISVICALLLISPFVGHNAGAPEHTSDKQIEATEPAETTTTVPTTEDLALKYGKEADELISSRQDYYDDLEFDTLSARADAILEKGSDVLGEGDKAELQELSACSAALGNIHDNNYSFSESSDPSESDYDVLKSSQYCPQEIYSALTEYEEYNNQQWKREDIEEHDSGTETTTYTVTAFTSFELKDEENGFEADNIKPVIRLAVKYDDEEETLDGTDTVSAEEATDDTADVELNDGTDCSVELDQPKEISLRINGEERTLSNVITAAADVVHRTDLRTRAADADSDSDSDSGSGSYTVYITKSGDKYHSSGCSYLRSSKIPIDKDDAEARGYEPCSRCNP